MTKNLKAEIKAKATIRNKTKGKNTRRKRKGKVIDKVKTNLLSIIIFFTAILLIFSSYAWLSASLNVKVKFFDLSVSTDNGLFISLDGVEYSDSVEISINSVISDLKSTYPNHTNQWAVGGMWPVSSNGIKDTNRNKFDVYAGEVKRPKGRIRDKRKFLDTRLIKEEEASAANIYISFDLFLKNVSGSPNSDNLYLSEDTYIDFDDKDGDGTPDLSNIYDDTPEQIIRSMSGIINSMRFGLVKIGSTSSKSDINTIQNLTCNNQCEMLIFEPNGTLHSEFSIEKAKEQNITLVDGVYTPTYAVINEGTLLQHTNGQEGTGIPLDTNHFTLQKTINEKDFSKSIFQIPNGVTKLRAYVWIEGQDIDSLETNSKGAAIAIGIDFVKDLAGYE